MVEFARDYAVELFAGGLLAMCLVAYMRYERVRRLTQEKRAAIRQSAIDAMEEQRDLHRQLVASFSDGERRAGFSLVETLVATALIMILLVTVVGVFSSMLDATRDSRAMIEVNDRLRYTKDRLALDLAGVTVPMLPPRRPENGEGYFEYIEGPVGPIIPPQTVSPYDVDGDGTFDPDTTVGDTDDILMFTTRSAGDPFIGKAELPAGTAQSQVAEVCWFLRGTTLYRRQLLVAPGIEQSLPSGWDTATGFYARNDISARQEGGSRDWRNSAAAPTLRLNTLGDLTKRENRYGHQPWAYPHDARYWGALGLPTLRECSDPAWPFPFHANTLPAGASDADWQIGSSTVQRILPNVTDGTAMEDSFTQAGIPNPPRVQLTGTFDAWENPFPWTETVPQHGTLTGYQNGTRIADDIILTNVLSFDVKAFDPGAPIFAAAAGTGTIEPTGEYPEQNWYRFQTNTTTGTTRPFFTDPRPVELTGVDVPIGFGTYVDLNYMAGLGASILYPQPADTNDPPDPRIGFAATGFPQSDFFGPGQNSFLLGPSSAATAGLANAAPAVYDTWSTHYERDGFNQDGDTITAIDPLTGMPRVFPLSDEGTNGLDDNGIGGADDVTEQEAPPPYPVPLRGIQVKIRIFEPSTRQIREVTVVQDFVGQ